MSTRALIIFEHDSALGTAPSHRLFEALEVKKDNGARRARP
jgi:hypothetical protein